MNGLALVGLGACVAGIGVADWNFFMENYKTRRVTALVGRDFTRVFLVVLGAAMVVGGITIEVTGG